MLFRSLGISSICLPIRFSPSSTRPCPDKNQWHSIGSQSLRRFSPWASGLHNIPPAKSALDSRVNPNYYRVDVSLIHPPGVYYPTNLEEITKDECDIIDIVQAHSGPSHDIADSLSYDLLARFPKSRAVRIGFSPDIHRNLKPVGLKSARYHISVPNYNSKYYDRSSLPYFQVTTNWRSDFLAKPVDILLATQENITSNISDHDIDSEQTSYRDHIEPSTRSQANLGNAHPTLYVHQEAVRSAASQDTLGEAAALRIAQLVFEKTDKLYNDKRLEIVIVSMKEVRSNHQETSNSCAITVARMQYERSQSSMLNGSLQPGRQKVYIALGSNIGDRISLMESACREMQHRGLNVIRTSALYETKAMYLEDQQPFINGACEVETVLSPMELLDTLKDIEKHLGRVKTIENGPRTIDLDILMYGKEMIEHERLSIPHKRMLERGFVLQPLCDLIPHTVPPIPNAFATFQEELDNLPSTQDGLSPLTPLSSHLNPISSRNPARPTHLMAILNLTPDSFSDGGLHSTTDPSSLLPTLHSYLTQNNPISILDIGGQSTRPHAPQSSPGEELSRILPTIKLIRSDPSFQKLAISVDTYRASVAAVAIEAGADIVNDVSAGQLDPDMLPTIARLGCTCILMHMRGTPDTMTKLTDYPDGIIKGVGQELLARVREAENAGIRRWRIMLDPGIGFAKTQAQNIELLRRFGELRELEGLRGLPWVVGASRKGFIGKITGVEQASERKWGTAATIAAAIQGGADVVRVHDVQEMGQVVKMSDAIWRG